LIRLLWAFRSSSGRCAPSRHPAEGHPQVLIIAPFARGIHRAVPLGGWIGLRRFRVCGARRRCRTSDEPSDASTGLATVHLPSPVRALNRVHCGSAGTQDDTDAVVALLHPAGTRQRDVDATVEREPPCCSQRADLPTTVRHEGQAEVATAAGGLWRAPRARPAGPRTTRGDEQHSDSYARSRDCVLPITVASTHEIAERFRSRPATG